MPRRAPAAFAAVSPFALPAGAAPVAASNDNQADPAAQARLRAALRLFAEHGLGAGRRAQDKAEAAFFAGERERYRWWLSVTRTLDRQLAVELAGRMGSETFGAHIRPKGGRAS